MKPTIEHWSVDAMKEQLITGTEICNKILFLQAVLAYETT